MSDMPDMEVRRMVAIAAGLEPVDGGAPPALHAVATEPGAAIVASAERSMARAALIGVLLGIPIGAVVWMGLVTIALTFSASGDWNVAAWLGMAAVVGAFAGSFFGGWVGVTVTAEHLDEVENTVF